MASVAVLLWPLTLFPLVTLTIQKTLFLSLPILGHSL